jgi:ribonuclease E
VIDFIDMEERRNNRKVENRLKDALRHDRARIQVGRISHFGLLEMSRQRLRTGVLEGSTTQCPHCQGTGIIRSVESVALAVLRALEDHLLRDARSSLTAVTTADGALYILNNKRAFVTEMEQRYGVTIAVQASERMQGANFAIERSAAPVTQRVVERTAINMESGFERQEGEEDVVEDAEPPPERDGGGRRPRRRRRRGRGRDERDEERSSYREHRGGERALSSGHSESDDAGPETGQGDEPPELRPQVREEFAEQPVDIPAGMGEQPSLPYGEVARDDGRDEDREDRSGRRRRRGRRGGRRGRGRDQGPREGEEEHAEPGAQASEAGNGASEPHAAAAHDADVAFEAPSAEAQSPAAPDASTEPDVREQAWPADADRFGREPEPPQQAAASSTAASPDAGDPEPAHAQPSEPDGEDPSRPARKGWWQRRFSGA